MEYLPDKTYVIRFMKFVIKLSLQFIDNFELKCQNLATVRLTPVCVQRYNMSCQILFAVENQNSVFFAGIQYR